HQRTGRVGGGLPAVGVPALQTRTAGGQADLGRAGGHWRLSTIARRRYGNGAALRLLDAGRRGGGRESRRCAGRRGGARTEGRAGRPGPETGEGGPAGAGTTEKNPSAKGEKPRLSELPSAAEG